jgi:SET domain-containing protein
MDGLPGQIVDGFNLRNHMRWINHSKEPNAKAYVYGDQLGASKIVIRALRYIKKGEEVYINYDYDPTQPDKSLISAYCKKRNLEEKREESHCVLCGNVVRSFIENVIAPICSLCTELYSKAQ